MSEEEREGGREGVRGGGMEGGRSGVTRKYIII